MRIFLDANILFSASNAQSNLYRFITFEARHSTFITSVYAQEEAQRNLQRKRPDWQNGFIHLLKRITIVPDYPLFENVALHEKDRQILGSAIAARCDYFCTGDKKDFGHLYYKTVAGVTIVDYVTLANLVLQA